MPCPGLTYGDGAEELDAWSPDGAWIYFADGRGDPGGHPDIWRVAATGGTPMRVLADRYAPEFNASVSPDGRTLAFAGQARMAQAQWWRHGHAHIDEAEIWLATPGDVPTYRQLSESGSKNVSPMWRADGREVVYVSDRSGSENLWAQPADGGAARRLTRFETGRLLFPTLSQDGGTVVFERDFGIWRMRLPDGTPQPVQVTLRGAPQAASVEHMSLSSVSDLALSPDGKKVAFTARGEVFAASAEDGGQAARVTRTVAPEAEPTWAPDSRRLAYTSRRSGTPKLFLYDFTTGEERALTRGEGSDVTPRFSPDGKKLAYVHGGRELHVMDVASGDDRRVATGLLWDAPFTPDAPIAWSPDGKWIAYLANDERLFQNVWVVPSAGGEARAVSGLANSSGSSLAWAKDGKTIYFDTQHRTEEGQVARVDLVPRTPFFREDKFQELFQDKKPTGNKSDSSSSAAGRRRHGGRPRGLRRPARAPVAAADRGGRGLAGAVAGRQDAGLHGVGRGAAEPVRLQRGSGGRGAAHRAAAHLDAGLQEHPAFTPDGKTVYFLDRGHIQSVDVKSGSAKTVAVTAEMDVDFDAEKMEVFDEGWSYIRDNFYDGNFHGADWQAVRSAFEPYMRGARTRPEQSRLMNLMIGELNGSHLGHGIQGPSGPTSGELGLRFDRLGVRVHRQAPRDRGGARWARPTCRAASPWATGSSRRTGATSTRAPISTRSCRTGWTARSRCASPPTPEGAAPTR